MILQSPLKAVVDQRLLHLLNKTPKTESGQARGPAPTSASQEQLGVQALADVLDTVLQGNRRTKPGQAPQEDKYVEPAGHKELKEDIINQILPQYLPRFGDTNAPEEPKLPESKILQDKGNRYLKGIDVSSLMQYPSEQSENNSSSKDFIVEHLFDLSTIQSFIRRLQSLAAGVDNQAIPEDRIMTFLTEQYPREPDEVYDFGK